MFFFLVCTSVRARVQYHRCCCCYCCCCCCCFLVCVSLCVFYVSWLCQTSPLLPVFPLPCYIHIDRSYNDLFVVSLVLFCVCVCLGGTPLISLSLAPPLFRRPPQTHSHKQAKCM